MLILSQAAESARPPIHRKRNTVIAMDCSYIFPKAHGQEPVHSKLRPEVLTSTQCQLHKYLVCTHSRITLLQSFQNQTCSSSLDDQSLQKEGS
uniref:Uncharacterized protein n=1 Tax=Arundo donax TaxID=35708 RepID=A0A0A9B685_ARUDO